MTSVFFSNTVESFIGPSPPRLSDSPLSPVHWLGHVFLECHLSEWVTVVCAADVIKELLMPIGVCFDEQLNLVVNVLQNAGG